MEDLSCPYCGGNLFVHGTCRRHLKATGGNAILRLRIMECRSCGATHREMPEGLVPYKRYSAEMLCAIFNGDLPESNEAAASIDTLISRVQKTYADDVCICDISVRQRIIKWLSWFFVCAQNIDEINSDSTSSSDSVCDKLKRFVRIIVNKGKWKQHYFTMPGT